MIALLHYRGTVLYYIEYRTINSFLSVIDFIVVVKIVDYMIHIHIYISYNNIESPSINI